MPAITKFNSSYTYSTPGTGKPVTYRRSPSGSKYQNTYYKESDINWFDRFKKEKYFYNSLDNKIYEIPTDIKYDPYVERYYQNYVDKSLSNDPFGHNLMSKEEFVKSILTGSNARLVRQDDGTTYLLSNATSDDLKFDPTYFNEIARDPFEGDSEYTGTDETRVAPAIGAALIGLAGTAASTGAGLYSNERSTKKNREWQEHMTEKQWQHDKEVTDDNRAWAEYLYHQYQSPSALRAAYQAAGLSPVLGESVPGFQDSSLGEMPSSAVAEYSDVSNSKQISEMFSQMFKQATEISLMRSQKEKLDADTEGSKINNKSLEDRNYASYALDSALANLYEAKRLTEGEERRLKHYMANREYISERIDQATFFSRCDLVREMVNNYKASTALLESKKTLTDKEDLVFNSVISKYQAETITTLFSMNVMAAQAFLYENEGKYYSALSEKEQVVANAFKANAEKFKNVFGIDLDVKQQTYQSVISAIQSNAAYQAFLSDPENMKTLFDLQIRLVDIRDREAWFKGFNDFLGNIVDGIEAAATVKGLGSGSKLPPREVVPPTQWTTTNSK